MEKDIGQYTFEALREFVVYSEEKIENVDDLLKIYIIMKNQGYFYEADKDGKMNEVKKYLRKFSKAYSIDKDILEKDLKFMGYKKVLEKLEQIDKNKSVK